MLLLATLLGCPAIATLEVDVLDCDAVCWDRGTIEVPMEHWDAWVDGSACDDGGLFLTYGRDCVATTQICDSSWADDPKVGDASGCCGGDLDPEAVTSAPGCDAAP